MRRKISEGLNHALPWALMFSAIGYLVWDDFETARYLIILYGIVVITDQLREIAKNISFVWWTLYHHPNGKEEQDE
ncbi:hypothetical protein [Enterococcus asini]|uniref:hypothetical protein n=1 Tax=Enterococcus asini TaxID=57732 RepID=UPI0022E24197|nr:hypothetical protein [Enterococcus asini]